VTATARPAPADAELRRLCDMATDDFVAYRAGERAALDRLVRALTPMLWQVARAYRLDTATAEDVVQTTWLTLVRRADSVADPQALVRWLTVTTRRESWRVLRSTGRTDPIDDGAVDVRAPSEQGPEAAVVTGARDEALWGAVSRLDERCRRLLRVVAFHDRPDYGTLSRELGMPVGSIGPTRGRCLAKLRQLLVDRGWSPA
jgi:RNA polymerase sigma factor (sigma-70 family)